MSIATFLQILVYIPFYTLASVLEYTIVYLFFLFYTCLFHTCLKIFPPCLYLSIHVYTYLSIHIFLYKLSNNICIYIILNVCLSGLFCQYICLHLLASKYMYIYTFLYNLLNAVVCTFSSLSILLFLLYVYFFVYAILTTLSFYLPILFVHNIA